MSLRPWERVDRIRAKNPDVTIGEACAEAGVSSSWYYISRKRDHDGKPATNKGKKAKKKAQAEAVVEAEVETDELGDAAVQPLNYEEALALYDTVQLEAIEKSLDVDAACRKLGFGWDSYLQAAKLVEDRQTEERRKREEENKGAKEVYFERAVENGMKKALGVAKKIRAVPRGAGGVIATVQPGQATVVRGESEVTAIVLRGSPDSLAALLERLV